MDEFEKWTVRLVFSGVFIVAGWVLLYNGAGAEMWSQRWWLIGAGGALLIIGTQIRNRRQKP